MHVLQSVDANDIEIAGGGVLIDAASEARFVEDLPAELRPKDIG